MGEFVTKDQVAVFDYTSDRAFLWDGRVLGRNAPGDIEVEGHESASLGLFSVDPASKLRVADFAHVTPSLIGTQEFPFFANAEFVADQCGGVSLPINRLSELTLGVVVEGATRGWDDEGCEYIEVGCNLEELRKPNDVMVANGDELSAARSMLSLFVGNINALRKWGGLSRVYVRIPFEVGFWRFPAMTRVRCYARLSLHFHHEKRLRAREAA